MDSLYFLIPIAILLVGTAVKLFFWAVNSGQYDDLETEARRILFDDDKPKHVPGASKTNGDEQGEDN